MRLKVWETRKGICYCCRQQIIGHKEKWIVEHVLARGIGGKDELDNYWPCHETCRREKDKIDIKMIAKTKRMKQRNLGIKTTKSSFGGGRNSKFKKKLDGTVVLR
jgi:5-methylcytosine-specific restriction enzyme A